MQLRFVKSEATFTYFEASGSPGKGAPSQGNFFWDAAIDFADEFMADYKRHFAKAPRHDFDVHRPLETDDDLFSQHQYGIGNRPHLE